MTQLFLSALALIISFHLGYSAQAQMQSAENFMQRYKQGGENHRALDLLYTKGLASLPHRLNVKFLIGFV
jgi:hypothetical protein